MFLCRIIFSESWKPPFGMMLSAALSPPPSFPGLAEGENPKSMNGLNVLLGVASRADGTPPARPSGSGLACGARE